jgi:hypothetical protein
MNHNSSSQKPRNYLSQEAGLSNYGQTFICRLVAMETEWTPTEYQ